MSTEVLVVGAGPTGLTMASELLRHGASVRLIDKLPFPAPHSRAMAIHARSLETFERMGVIEPFLAAGAVMQGAAIFAEGRQLAWIALRRLSDETAYPYVLMLEQNLTEAILTAHLAELGGRVERGVELVASTESGEGVEATLRLADGRTEAARFRYVVGCDGAHSTVRKLSGIPFEGAAYPQAFYLADVRLDGPLPKDKLSFCLSQKGFFAVFPFNRDLYRIVIVNEEDFQPKGEDPTLEELNAFLKETFGSSIKASAPEWLTRFRLHHRSVPRFSKGRLFLAGDAAHIHSPAGGQGMNTGIQDAFNLAWKLAFVLRGRLSETALSSYDEERVPVAKRLLRSTDSLFRFISAKNAPLRFTLRHLVPLVANSLLQLAPVQKRGTRFLTQLGIRYDDSSLFAALGPSPLRGQRLPDGEIASPDPVGTRRLHAALAGTAYALVLLCQGETPAAALRKFSDSRKRIEQEVTGEIPCFIDTGSEVARHLGVTSPTLILVRPDGYIAWSS